MLLKARLKAAPQDASAAAALAQLYIGAGRREADPRFYGYAQAALAPWWREAAPPPSIRLLRATLLQATHQFDAARADLQALVRGDPGNGQAWLTLATVQTVTGDYRQAIASCRQLERLVSAAVAAACLSGPQAATGRAASAAALLDAQRRQVDDPALLAWLAGIQGELAARLGNYEQAGAHYRAALAADPADSYVLGAYADMLLDLGRFDEVDSLLAPHGRNDALLLRRALALRGAGRDRPALERAVAELDARFAAAARRGDAVHQREQARFALHLKQDVAAAMALAQRNWRVQKEVADARILLEAAAASGEPANARPVLDWLRQHRLQDVALERLAARLGRT
jgi:tetratricopeptide (TPR) repeat protein